MHILLSADFYGTESKMDTTVALTETQINFFEQNGYLIIRDLLDVDAHLGPVVDEYGELIDRLLEAWSADPGGSGESVFDRLLRLMRVSEGASFQALDISLPLEEDVVSDTPVHLGPAVFELMTNSRLLDAVESLIGPEIYSNPVQHVRVKPPERELSAELRDHTLISRTFWHQDLAVITEDADDTDVVSVWLPIVEATEENGCLVVVPGSHREDLVHHCRTDAAKGIPEPLIGSERLPLPMRPGDVLFFHRLTKHASLSNRSDAVRWSFDLRYSPVGTPTGRSWFPGFVARSKSQPEQVLTDAQAWAASWLRARADLAGLDRPEFNRWKADDPLCA
jgi:phytanoyl-CoA hydroxylase